MVHRLERHGQTESHAGAAGLGAGGASAPDLYYVGSQGVLLAVTSSHKYFLQYGIPTFSARYC